MHNNLDKQSSVIGSFNYRTGDAETISNGFRQTMRKLPEPPRSLNLILNSLPANEFNLLLSLAEKVEFSENENIYDCGDRFTHLYFPLTAVFSQIQILEDGKTCETALFGRETCIGLPAILNSRLPANGWVETAVGGSVLKLSLSVFNQKFGSDSFLFRKLLASVNLNIKQLSQKIVCSNFHSLTERFCSRLLALQKRSLKSAFLMTHDEIARYLGAQRPSVSIIAKQFQHERIVSYSRGKIKIVNYQKLKERACQCE